jgi:hypothetical protein
MSENAEIDVTECPDCGQKGRYDGRILIGGRGVYRCPDGHRWQDATEKPTNKGTPINLGSGTRSSGVAQAGPGGAVEAERRQDQAEPCNSAPPTKPISREQTDA